jgi:hypothetical protein
MARAIRLLVIFGVLTLILHYIGPAINLVLKVTPSVLQTLAAFGGAVEVPF